MSDRDKSYPSLVLELFGIHALHVPSTQLMNDNMLANLRHELMGRQWHRIRSVDT